MAVILGRIGLGVRIADNNLQITGPTRQGVVRMEIPDVVISRPAPLLLGHDTVTEGVGLDRSLGQEEIPEHAPTAHAGPGHHLEKC